MFAKSRKKRSDYYIKAFKKLEQKETHTWNWSAFFFSSLWMVYRKMYFYSIIGSVLSCILFFFLLIIGSLCFGNGNLETTSSNMIFGVICLLSWGILGSVYGYYGNYWYRNLIEIRILRGYHKVVKFRPTSWIAPFCSPLIIFFGDLISKNVQLDKYKLKPEDKVPTLENISNYLEPNKPKHWIEWMADVVAVIFSCFCLIIFIGIMATVENDSKQHINQTQSDITAEKH
ncbi:MAG: DUF2628 domain-containing protein [Alphaproteobacteria bacterium]|nr:DUF2628 domain-containing protein [Alphaproteobacteria bacterium]